eukprot:g387.t1
MTTFLLQVVLLGVRAHPGAIAAGRASCGDEYTTPATAFEIPDAGEAWFFRRVATCAQPVVWLKFEARSALQKLYIAANTPKIARFADRLNFHAALYGPGLPPLAPSAVPARVAALAPLGATTGLALQSPARFDSCAFVSNAVMSQYTSLTNERCSEEMAFKDYDSKDSLMSHLTWKVWWLFSRDLTLREQGSHYLAMWLTDRASGELAAGKFELTVGPWTWSGYAAKSVQAKANAQGTRCACATNALAYGEQEVARLGGELPARFVAELPAGSCGAAAAAAAAAGAGGGGGRAGAETCAATPLHPKISAGSAVEWSAVWVLPAPGTYRWVFRAFRRAGGALGYPDASMDLYVEAAPGAVLTRAAEMAADARLSAAASSSTPPRALQWDGGSGGGWRLASSAASGAQRISFAPGNATTTLLLAAGAAGTAIAVFTQHQPMEFMAGVLLAPDGSYVFPRLQRLYSDAPTPPPVPSDGVARGSGGGGVMSARAAGVLVSAVLLGAVLLGAVLLRRRGGKRAGAESGNAPVAPPVATPAAGGAKAEDPPVEESAVAVVSQMLGVGAGAGAGEC